MCKGHCISNLNNCDLSILTTYWIAEFVAIILSISEYLDFDYYQDFWTNTVFCKQIWSMKYCFFRILNEQKNFQRLSNPKNLFSCTSFFISRACIGKWLNYSESSVKLWKKQLYKDFHEETVKYHEESHIRVIICPSTQLRVVSSVHLYYSYIFLHYMFRLTGSHLQMW
jgi:hypothetical protein